VIVNILGFHVFLAKGGYGVPVAVLAAEVYLAWVYRDSFAAILRVRAVPRGHEVTATRAAAEATAR